MHGRGRLRIFIQRWRRVLLAAAVAATVLAVGILVGFAAGHSVKGKHTSLQKSSAGNDTAMMQWLPPIGSAAATTLLAQQRVPGWVQELYLHQHDAATITAPHSTKFLQLLQQLLGGAPVAAAAAAAVEPILAGPAQGPVGTAAAASNSRMAAHKLSYVLSSIGNSGGNQGLSMPPGDSSQHAGVSAVSFSSSSTSSTIGSLSSSSSGGNSGSNRASIALQPFIDSAQDVLSYLRYHHSQALLQWLRDFSHQGLPGFYATSADPVNLRAEVERLLNPTRLQQWYQQAASGDRDDKSQQQQWLVVQASNRRLLSSQQLQPTAAAAALADTDLTSQLLSRMLGFAGASPSAAPTQPLQQQASHKPRQQAADVSVSLAAIPSTAIAVPGAGSAPAHLEVGFMSQPDMDEDVVIIEEEVVQPSSLLDQEAGPAGVWLPAIPAETDFVEDDALMMPYDPFKEGADMQQPSVPGKGLTTQPQPQKQQPRGGGLGSTSGAKGESSSGGTTTSSGGSKEQRQPQMDAAPVAVPASPGQGWHTFVPEQAPRVWHSALTSMPRPASNHAHASAPAAPAVTEMQLALCDVLRFSPSGLQGVVPQAQACPLAPASDGIGIGSQASATLTVPLVFHCLAFSRAAPHVDKAAGATPAAYLLPPNWQHDAAAANLVAEANKIFQGTGIMFKLREVRSDPTQYPYLMQPSLDSWQACTYNTASRTAGAACLEGIAANAAATTHTAAVHIIVAGSREQRGYCDTSTMAPAPACIQLSNGHSHPLDPWAAHQLSPGWQGDLPPVSPAASSTGGWVYLSYDMFDPATANAARFGNRGAAVLARQLARYLGVAPAVSGPACSMPPGQLPALAAWCNAFKAGQQPTAAQLSSLTTCPAELFAVPAAGTPDSCAMKFSSVQATVMRAATQRHFRSVL